MAPGFMIVYARITDAEQFRVYANAVGPLIARFGGRLIGRTEAPQVLEGEFPWQTIGLLEFPTLAAAEDFWNSAEYTTVKRLRVGAADFQVVLVEAIPIPVGSSCS